MSTMIDSAAGKGRNLSTNAWIALLVGSLVVFAGNTLYATTKAARVGGASTAASNLQVNSQRLAVQGQEAVSGNAESYKAFKAATADEVSAGPGGGMGGRGGGFPLRSFADQRRKYLLGHAEIKKLAAK